ncbi:hypothetical protein FXO37_34755 [Capsicum annuum]|nr:hypothetical protein FXO37_34755 [Capsicum annuum]
MGHKCKTSKQLYLLELEEVDETDNVMDKTEVEVHEEKKRNLELSQPAEHMEISIHALNGSLGFTTLRVTGYHAKKGLHILIDTGSSHNFIDPDLVQQLGKHGLRSTGNQLQTLGAGKLAKHSVVYHLPGEFDHRIILQAGTETMNKRPYRYKDIIEGLVQQMLEQRITQPSCSPFASPVVLVGKKNGTWRLCVDYRDLNKFTVKNKFPIHIVEDLLDELEDQKHFQRLT